ncbi:MAG: hypothetical protein AAFU49_12935 [Pseudomonadota bacterium]
MTDAPSGWTTVWKINAACLRVTASGVLAWLFWQGGTEPGFEGLLFVAAIFALVAVKHAGIALIETVRLVLRARKWARFQAKGAKPKADRMAAEADLKARGLIR